METSILTRRTLLLGAASLPGCTALTSLNQAAQPLDVYDLSPTAGAAAGASTRRNLLVVEPSAPAAIATDRILIRPDSLSVAYLPDARWTDAVPAMFQSLLVRSLSATGRIGFVGVVGAGPVPDLVLLTRIDRFEVVTTDDGTFEAQVTAQLTLLRDIDQRVVGSRQFKGVATASNDSARSIVKAMQQVIDSVLPAGVDWTANRMTR